MNNQQKDNQFAGVVATLAVVGGFGALIAINPGQPGPVGLNSICSYQEETAQLIQEPCQVDTLKDDQGYDYYEITTQDGTKAVVTLYSNGTVEFTTRLGTLETTYVEVDRQVIMNLKGKTMTFRF